jgi:hypothetical protein
LSKLAHTPVNRNDDLKNDTGWVNEEAVIKCEARGFVATEANRQAVEKWQSEPESDSDHETRKWPQTEKVGR